MAKVVGDLPVPVGDKTYILHLGFRAIAQLQDEFGRDLGPIIGAFESGKLPDFRAIVRLIEVSLERYHPGATSEIADEILAENPKIFAELLSTAFPAPEQAKPGGAAAKKRTRAV